MPTDILIGTISGYQLDTIEYWLNSLDQCGYVGKRVMLICNGDAHLIKALRAREFEVVTYSEDPATGHSSYPRESFQDEDVSAERFYLMWQYLASQSLENYRYVISVDVRDAIFQTDPSAWLTQNLGNKLLNVSSETIAYEDEEWNRMSLLDNFGEQVYEHIRRRVVWNAGVIAGAASCFRDLCLNVHLLCRSTSTTYSDQAALNVLLSMEPYRHITRFSLSEDGWACHAGTVVDAAMPENLRTKRRERAPAFDGDYVYTATGLKYCIVHQYDRVPQWVNVLTAKYETAT